MIDLEGELAAARLSPQIFAVRGVVPRGAATAVVAHGIRRSARQR